MGALLWDFSYFVVMGISYGHKLFLCSFLCSFLRGFLWHSFRWHSLCGIVLLACVLGTGFGTSLLEQDKKRIRYSARILEGKAGATPDAEAYRLLRDSVIFTHKGKRMYCDSARFFAQRQYIEAYSRIHVIDSARHMYAQRLTYDAETDWVRLRDSVHYQSNEMDLYCDSLDYNTTTQQGFFAGRGRLIDDTRTLTSVQGYYDARADRATFIGDVHVYAPDYHVQTDTLYYTRGLSHNGLSRTILKGTTRLWVSDSVQIEAQGGIIDQWEGPSSGGLGQRFIFFSACYYTPTQTVCADSLRVEASGRQEAMGNVRLLREGVLVLGEYAYYDSTEAVCIGQRLDTLYVQPLLLRTAGVGAVAVADTLFLQADTLRLALDVTGDMEAVEAYGRARTYQGAFASRSDSVLYGMGDSTIYFLGDPILWQDETQLTADKIEARVVDRILDRLTLRDRVLVVSHDTLGYYNQVGGRFTEAWFSNGAIDSIQVVGNGESIYFTHQGDTLLLGMNRTISGAVTMYFSQDTLRRVVFIQNPEGVFYPPNFIDQENQYLSYFEWHTAVRMGELEARQRLLWWLCGDSWPAVWEVIYQPRPIYPLSIVEGL